MRKISTTALMTLFIITFCSMVSAQIVAWDFNAKVGNEASVNATTQNVNMITSSITRGSGINATSLADAFSSSNYTENGTETDAISNNDYLEFTIQSKLGYEITLTTLDANFRRSDNGPTTFQWQYSLDGFATDGIDIGSEISFTSTSNTNGYAQTQIDLSGISALQNVKSTTIITIRLYGYGASSASGRFALGRLSGDDLAIDGVIALPVELTGFEGYSSRNSVTLKWRTATEVNNYGFEVERSQNSESGSPNFNWAKIGFVAGSGNSNSPKSYSFTDKPIGGTSFRYKLKQIDIDGKFKYYGPLTVKLNGSSVAKLLQNNPNPFNPSTAIKFYIPSDSRVKVAIYDILGRKITTLINEQKQAGYHIIYWNGKDRNGMHVASGVYLYRLFAGNYVKTKKMNLLK